MKSEEFYTAILSSDADFFAIMETGLNNSFKDAEIVPPGYSIMRSDRADGWKQGGVCLVATPCFELRRVSCDVNIEERASN